MNTQELRIHALRRLHELAEAKGYHRFFSLDEIAAEVGVGDRMKVLGLGQDLEADGLVTLVAAHDGTSAAIKMRGVKVAEEALASPKSSIVPVETNISSRANVMKLQVFVSSTYTDLKEERQAAVEAILKAGHIPAGMELFAAGNESQLETIRRWIGQSDIFMLILGGRYGSIEPTTGLSYTEVEYDHAVSIDMPFFAVVIEPQALEEKIKKYGSSVVETANGQLRASFQEKVLKRQSAFFSDSRDIRLAVHEAIKDFIGRCNFNGWVPGEELRRLSEENSRFADEIQSLRLQINEAGGGSRPTFESLVSVLDAIKLPTAILNEAGDDQPRQVSALELLDRFKERLILGVTNGENIKQAEAVLYYNLMPKLQLHGLSVNETIPGVSYRRYGLTPLGVEFVAFLETRNKERITPD